MAMAMSLATPVMAVQIPDAGAAMRQNDQLQKPALPPATAPTLRHGVNDERPSLGPTVVVTKFIFEGSTRFTDAELQTMASPWLNRPVTLADLETTAALVAAHYRREGWLARVFLPPQEVSGGAIRFKIIEATFGGTRFTDDTDPKSLPMDKGEITDRVEARQARGEKYYIPSLERGLLIADDLPGVNVSGSQVGGTKTGETDVLVKAAAEPMLYGNTSIDNAGSRSTGSERALLRLGLSSPFGIGDQIDLQMLLTRYQQYARLAGSLPIGDDGVRLAANFSALNYKIGTSEFEALKIRGSYLTGGLDLIYPMIRQSTHNLFLGVGLERKLPYNETIAGVMSDYAINNALFRAEGNLYDTFLGQGISSASLEGGIGYVDLDGSPNKLADALTTDTAGEFEVLRWRVARNQAFAPEWSVVAALSGQLADKNLDSAEKFYLGGPTGVRAYPVYEGGGSQGELLNLELHWTPLFARACDCEIYTFYDWGHIEQSVDNSFVGAASPNSYSLSGYGVGVAGTAPYGFHVSALVGFRIGNNPNPTLTGKDQDGSSSQPRVWLSLSKDI